ncbi:hypothetical protein [Komagataeibacter xylinus]|uniref:hypothetical protein n=1 Tax=Komagataeibacter xylinus TaxID=28448 RepID=UPI00132FB44F|nr:hypothetical protein [Komagataeibacter xylinus]
MISLNARKNDLGVNEPGVNARPRHAPWHMMDCPDKISGKSFCKKHQTITF